jgi:hypothetical protein
MSTSYYVKYKELQIMTTMYLLLFTCTVQYNDIYDRSVRKSGVLQRLVRYPSEYGSTVDLEPSGVA